MHPGNRGQRLPNPRHLAKDVLDDTVEVFKVDLVIEPERITLGDEKVILIVAVALPECQLVAVPVLGRDGELEPLSSLFSADHIGHLAGTGAVAVSRYRHYASLLALAEWAWPRYPAQGGRSSAAISQQRRSGPRSPRRWPQALELRPAWLFYASLISPGRTPGAVS